MRASVLLLLVACSSTPGPVATPVLPDVPFALLDFDQKMTFMKERVVPAMAPLFRTHDAKQYAEFGCATCHADGDYSMPNAELPALELPNRGRHEARDVEWMTSSIKPAMARLLDDSSIDCTRCHVRATK